MIKSLIIIGSLFMSTSAIAQVPVGVIDGLSETKLANVVSRDYTPQGQVPGGKRTPDGRQHADASIATILDAASKPVQIFHANPFVQRDDGLYLSWRGATLALDWFAQNNVKYVCTNFAQPEDERGRAFVDRATELGLTLITAVANPGEMPKGIASFPAVDKRTIAVTADDDLIAPRIVRAEMKLAKLARSPVAFGTNSDPRKGITAGTSFSAARACGELATK